MSFSPIRAVAYWPKDDRPVHNFMTRRRMMINIYEPLGLTCPTSAHHQELTMHAVNAYVTLTGVFSLSELICALRQDQQIDADAADEEYEGAIAELLIKHKLIKKRTHDPKPNLSKPIVSFWSVVTRFQSNQVIPLVSQRCERASVGVVSATSFEEIKTNPPTPLTNLFYTDESVSFLHRLVFDDMHRAPVPMFRRLCQYMQSTELPSRSCSNIYFCSHVCSLAQSIRKMWTTCLFTRTSKLPPNGRHGICFGTRNQQIDRIVNLYTVKMCPLCYKPVNLAIKRRSSASGAHKSQIFTDEYTGEPLYCNEKNTRGIVDFPLIELDKSSGVCYTNTLLWIPNSGFARTFTVKNDLLTHTSYLEIKDVDGKQPTYCPVETKKMCEEDEEEEDNTDNTNNNNKCVMCVLNDRTNFVQ